MQFFNLKKEKKWYLAIFRWKNAKKKLAKYPLW
jgi:hypothetical protein